MYKHSSFLGHLCMMKKMKCCEYSLRDNILNILFSLLVINDPNNLKCYITLGQKGLTSANTLAYWAIRK